MRKVLTKSLFLSLLFTFIVVGVLSMYLYEMREKYQGRVYPGVSINGQSFDGKTKNDVEMYFNKKNKTLAHISFTVVYEDAVASFSGETVNLHYNADTIAEGALQIGRSTHIPTMLQELIIRFFKLNTVSLTYKPSFDMKPVNEYLSELNSTYSVPAQDALFEFKDKRVTSFKVEKPGVQLTTKKATEDIEKYLASESYLAVGKSFSVAATELKPKVTIKDTNKFGIVEKIGEGVSDFTGSAPERVYNLTHAAKKLHGVLIPPGQNFSYNNAIGDISQATGFKPGYIIKDGRTVLGDGGGVCQDSTTMFRAALNTGLPIVERHAHAYRVKYYENDSKPGFDATVFAPSVDFRFKNDTPAHILVQASVDPVKKILLIELYGKKDGRKVELSEASLSGALPAPPPLYEDDPSLPTGTTKQVDWAASGIKSTFTYKVIAKDGSIIQDRTFYSSFRPWRAVYLVGKG